MWSSEKTSSWGNKWNYPGKDKGASKHTPTRPLHIENQNSTYSEYILSGPYNFKSAFRVNEGSGQSLALMVRLWSGADLHKDCNTKECVSLCVFVFRLRGEWLTRLEARNKHLKSLNTNMVKMSCSADPS